MMSSLHRRMAEMLIIDSPDTTAYTALCASFSALTNIQNDITGVCCMETDKHGAPKCCYTLTDGTCSLTFTDTEMQIITQLPGSRAMDNGVFFKYLTVPGYWKAEIRDVKKMRASLNDGFLSKTLECVSHPTRPVIENGKVINVAVVNDCIAEYAFDTLKEYASDFLWLWQQAVNLLGEKPYYITHGIDDPGKFDLLCES